MSRADCPACEGDQFDELEFVDVAEQHRLYAPDDQAMQKALNDAAAETGLNYQMLKCRRCGLEFCDPLIAPSAKWYELAYRAMDLHSFERWEFDEVLRRIPLGDHVFEFACGSGLFLQRCKNRGVLASGMDFSEDGVASCVARGLDARQVDLFKIPTSGEAERVSQMVAFHFIEHLERPDVLMEHAAAMALPGAQLWISVPSPRRTTRRFGMTESLDKPPHHMTRWTEEAFRQIGRRHGWRLAEAIYEPMPLKTILWWIVTRSPRYQSLEKAGRLKNRFVEKAYRAAALPFALTEWTRTHRDTSEYAILAHYIYDGVSNRLALV
jgi:methyltransferase family protein